MASWPHLTWPGSEVLHALDLIVIAEGTNDIRNGKSATWCHKNLMNIVNMIRERTETPILLIQPPPLNTENLEQDMEMKILAKKLEMEKTQDEQMIHIIQTNHTLEDLSEEYTTDDGFHLNEVGGETLASLINSTVSEIETAIQNLTPESKDPRTKVKTPEPNRTDGEDPPHTPNPPNTEAESITERIEVSDSMMGHVIGKSARGLEHYRSKNGVRVYSTEWEEGGKKRRGIIVTGEKRAVKQTVGEIEKDINERIESIANDKEARERRGKIVCKFDRKFGNCRWGDECQFIHNPTGGTPKPRSDPETTKQQERKQRTPDTHKPNSPMRDHTEPERQRPSRREPATERHRSSRREQPDHGRHRSPRRDRRESESHRQSRDTDRHRSESSRRNRSRSPRRHRSNDRETRPRSHSRNRNSHDRGSGRGSETRDHWPSLKKLRRH